MNRKFYVCQEDDCGEKHYCKGYCQKHYQRWKRLGDPLAVGSVHEKRDHEKWCPRCKCWLPKDNFTKSSYSDGLSQMCRGCQQARRMWVNYRITPEQYEAMLSQQGGCCAVCGATEPGGNGSRWHIDHDHNCCPGRKSCGECIRGLLCSKCNTGLGQFNDNPDTLVAAVAYLLQFSDILSQPTTQEVT
jgi:hypothetical protein